MARLEIEGVDNAVPRGRGGQCRSGLIGTVLARVDNAGENTCPSKLNISLFGQSFSYSYSFNIDEGP